MLLIFLFLAVLLLTYSNGANDNFKGVATLWGSGTLAYKPALVLATVIYTNTLRPWVAVVWSAF